MSERLSERAKRDLVELAVEVWTGNQVDGIDADGVTIGSQKVLAHSVFWAAGVQAARLQIQPPVATDRAGRIKVTSDFSVAGHPNVFVVGDMASFEVAPGKPLIALFAWYLLAARGVKRPAPAVTI